MVKLFLTEIPNEITMLITVQQSPFSLGWSFRDDINFSYSLRKNHVSFTMLSKISLLQSSQDEKIIFGTEIYR